MKTPRISPKNIIIILGIAVLFFQAWIVTPYSLNPLRENNLIKRIKKKLHHLSATRPEERIYLQLDKPMYMSGEDVWVAAYVCEGMTLKPSPISDILHVELISPGGNVIKKRSIIMQKGNGKADFSLDNESVGGLYKIRAYTNWMKNEGEDNIFEKEILVQDVILPHLKMKINFEKKSFGPGDEVLAKLELHSNENKPLSNHACTMEVRLAGKKYLEKKILTDEEGSSYIRFHLPSDLSNHDGLLNVVIDYNGNTESISRPIPIILNKINFTVLPEGGDWICGVNNHLAFKVTNEFGKPVEAEGIITDRSGNPVSKFSTYHNGMGSFFLTPKPGEEYYAKITRPEGNSQIFRLPEFLRSGYSMIVKRAENKEVSVLINSTKTDEMSLIASCRGKIYFSTPVHVSPGQNFISFSTENFPAGVTQITLFDSKEIPRAERLIFLNKEKKLNITIRTDKSKYLPREKVKMTILVKDEDGLPSPARLSLSVTNDMLISFADDKTGNILSHLLLQQDIKDKIEDPAFYFNPLEPKADKALDLLLLTSGWRRFTWEQIMQDHLPKIRFPAQKAIVSGIILDAETGKPVENSKIFTNEPEAVCSFKNGRFSIKNLILTSPVSLTFSAPEFHSQSKIVYDYDQEMVVYLYPKKYRYSYYNNSRKKSSSLPGANIQSQFSMVNPADPAPGEENIRSVEAFAEDHIIARGFNNNKLSQPDEQKSKSNNREEQRVVIDSRFADHEIKKELQSVRKPNESSSSTLYYRARTYFAPSYEKLEPVEIRTDFRNTIYWNPDIEIGFTGKKTIEFYTSDDISSFRITAEGINPDGILGRKEEVFYTQLPFSMVAKIPFEIVAEDILSIPITLQNNTDKPVGGRLLVMVPDALKELRLVDSIQILMPGETKTVFMDYKALAGKESGDLTITFKACGLSDAFTQKIKIVPRGFPVKYSFSSQESDKEFLFEIKNPVEKSLKISFNAFPNVISDLIKGVEGILSEPYGCFEQTSCSAYPNAMVLNYLNTTDNTDTKTLLYAKNLLDRGYKRLITFETKEKGFEWFGAVPAHEGLTAYGILEFTDMKKAGQSVDDDMLKRTLEWLLSQRDGKGGFKREQHAYHNFGLISNDIHNGYIVYALAEAGCKEVRKEFESAVETAKNTKDPYLLALSASAAFDFGEVQTGNQLLNILLTFRQKDGSFTGTSHSITYSTGKSLSIETTALSVLALLKAPQKNYSVINECIQFLVSSRSGSGVFGSTQGTILSLKALTEYAKSFLKNRENGTIQIFIDGKMATERNYTTDKNEPITIMNLENYIQDGEKHSIRIKFKNTRHPIPYSIAVNWNTYLPSSDPECKVGVSTSVSSTKIKAGETVRLTALIYNKTDKEIPSTMAIIGIPAGFSPQPWQLKELQEKRLFDYYEIKGNNLALYYRGMESKAVREINIDLKAEIPGVYQAPASVAYLYYTNEYKTWSMPDKIEIQKRNF